MEIVLWVVGIIVVILLLLAALGIVLQKLGYTREYYQKKREERKAAQDAVVADRRAWGLPDEPIPQEQFEGVIKAMTGKSPDELRTTEQIREDIERLELLEKERRIKERM